MDDGGSMRRCSSCRQLKAVTEFHKSSRPYSGGYQRQCKECNRASVRATHKKNGHSAYNDYRHAQALVSGAKRRALLESATCEHDVCKTIDRRVVWGRDEGYCRIKLVCDGVFVPFEEMHLDHAVPINKGGLHCYYNVQTGCPSCNFAKGDKVLEGTRT